MASVGNARMLTLYYRQVREVLVKESRVRTHPECVTVERWFRNHSKILKVLEQGGVFSTFISAFLYFQRIIVLAITLHQNDGLDGYKTSLFSRNYR